MSRDIPYLLSPVNAIYWIHRSQVSPNTYNPNKVASKEMDLLEYSILKIGYVFPILLMDDGQPIEYELNNQGVKVVKEGKNYTIIDGFHRFTISERPRIEKIYRGFVPVVFVENSDIEIITVMMNRAKGVHGVLPMSQIVLSLLSKGETVEKICEMGMDREEVMRLAQSQGITKDAVFNNLQYSNSWTPK